MDPAKTREIIDGLRKRLEGLPGYVKADSLLEKIMPHSVTIESKPAANPTVKKRTWGRQG
jgi:hypothetical protein